MKQYPVRHFFIKIAVFLLWAVCAFGDSSFSSQAKNPSGTDQEAPDVIVVMNESFFDPAVLGSFSVNSDYLPFYHSLEEGAADVSGHLLMGTLHVSDVGGNSTNTEFEFLTGNSMAFLSPKRSAYSSYLTSGSEYLPALFQRAGYKTAALYPYKGSSWNRNVAYSLMDFSEIYFQDSFDSSQTVRGYISDKAVYQKALKLCEDSSKPVFAFCSTIQNHSGYQESHPDFHGSITARGKGDASLDQYLSLLKVSDDALEYLIEQVSQAESNTMVVFFGNHQPNDYVVDSIYDDALLQKSSAVSPDLRYTVPYLIWANFDLSAYEMADTSPSLLGNTVLEAAGIQPDGLQGFLSAFKKLVPAISSQGYYDQERIFHPLPSPNASTEAETDWIRLYQKMQQADPASSNASANRSAMISQPSSEGCRPSYVRNAASGG